MRESDLPRRAAVLRLLRDAPEPLSITALADRLGVHANTVRFHLDTLLAGGQVERVAPTHRVPGRPPQFFRAVRRMDPEGPRNYRVLAEILVDTFRSAPRARARAVEAGRTWGRRQADQTDAAADADAIDRLVSMLDEFDFAPERQRREPVERETTASEIGLRNCPFLEIAEGRQDVVCGIHLGLMQGALEQWDAPVTVSQLRPFVEPDLCVAHLAAADTAHEGSGQKTTAKAPSTTSASVRTPSSARSTPAQTAP